MPPSQVFLDEKTSWAEKFRWANRAGQAPWGIHAANMIASFNTVLHGHAALTAAVDADTAENPRVIRLATDWYTEAASTLAFSRMLSLILSQTAQNNNFDIAKLAYDFNAHDFERSGIHNQPAFLSEAFGTTISMPAPDTYDWYQSDNGIYIRTRSPADPTSGYRSAMKGVYGQILDDRNTQFVSAVPRLDPTTWLNPS